MKASIKLLFTVLFISVSLACAADEEDDHPIVILISTDGFRWGYQWRAPTPNIHRLINNGTIAFPGMIPVYPTVTMPNHYAMTTGLYPAWHGIISNNFRDPYNLSSNYAKDFLHPKWMKVETIWETVTNNGLQAATAYWPGGDVPKGNWTCPSTYCPERNDSVSFEERVDRVLSYLDLPVRPSFVSLYFPRPDHDGHVYGPDTVEVTEAVVKIDEMIERLLDGLDARDLLDKVHIIVVSDHGMVMTCESKVIYLEDLAPWIKIPDEWVDTAGTWLAVRPPRSANLKKIVDRINHGLTRVPNGDKLKIYLKEDLPERLHYSAHEMIQPIIGMVAEGFRLELRRSNTNECGGVHGYDNDYASMRATFIAYGPRFPKATQVPSFRNLEIYNVITSILDIKGAPNNGSLDFAKSILLPA